MNHRICLFFLLASCSGSEPNQNGNGVVTATEPHEQNQIPSSNMDGPFVDGGKIQSYQHAIDCYARTDIVNDLSEAGAISQSAIVRGSKAALVHWWIRAKQEGDSAGKSVLQVRSDFEARQLELLAPLKSIPTDAAAAEIARIVQGAANCDA